MLLQARPRLNGVKIQSCAARATQRVTETSTRQNATGYKAVSAERAIHRPCLSDRRRLVWLTALDQAHDARSLFKHGQSLVYPFAREDIHHCDLKIQIYQTAPVETLGWKERQKHITG